MSHKTYKTYKTYKKLSKTKKNNKPQYGGVDSIQKTPINKLSNIISNTSDNLYNKGIIIADKGKDMLLQNINDLLESPKINELALKGETYLSDFNNQLHNPVFKKEFTETLENASDYATIGLKAMNQPIDEAIDKLNQSGTKAVSGALSGAIKVGTDAMAAIPGVGAIIELGKIANDGTKAVSSVMEASSEAAKTVDTFIADTNNNLSKLKENTEYNSLTKIKQQGGAIMERTTNSIRNFYKPIENYSSLKGYSTTGITKKKLLKRKSKTKRVRFNI
jgi:hypothetical protein